MHPAPIFNVVSNDHANPHNKTTRLNNVKPTLDSRPLLFIVILSMKMTLAVVSHRDNYCCGPSASPPVCKPSVLVVLPTDTADALICLQSSTLCACMTQRRRKFKFGSDILGRLVGQKSPQKKRKKCRFRFQTVSPISHAAERPGTPESAILSRFPQARVTNTQPLGTLGASDTENTRTSSEAHRWSTLHGIAGSQEALILRERSAALKQENTQPA